MTLSVEMTIPKDKIRELIGPKGQTIRAISTETKARVTVNDDGVVKISAPDEGAQEAAMTKIREAIADPEVGRIYEGTVVKVVPFGAFVNFSGHKDGLVHISELSPTRVNQVTDVVREGDVVRVKVIGFDQRGKVKLSIKAVNI
ncbi:MAG: S1 RNA-binding domain-containing protein [Holosporales bacterium]|jgi:polyribonucleotide nucleotidyltransferase|nr:S1 RNA-binding domain-containing protein [Holosporales bacterium]